MKEAVRHHYIPQFILRSFCGDNGCLSYFDISQQRIVEKKTEEVFMARNLYRDTVNNPDDPVKIEKDLSRFENEASHIIKRFLVESEEVQLTLEEDEKLKLFLAIMAFRGDRVKEIFSESSSEDFKEYYSLFQEDRNLNDFWKRNLGELVNCRSYEEVANNPRIDPPIKLFMMRDAAEITGLYFIPVERRGREDFMLSDCYPAVFEGSSDDGVIRLNMYSVYPISDSKALMLVANGVEAAPQSVSGFKKSFFRRPYYSRDGKILTFRYQKLYEPDVRRINDTIFLNASEGVVAKDFCRIHNV